MRSLPLLLTATALALFAAGCGDSDDDKGDAGSGARGYAETGQAVSDICKRATAESSKLAEGLNGKATHDAPIVEGVVAATAKYVEELKAITPDPKLQSTFDSYVAAVEAGQAEAEAAAEAAKSGDDKAYQAALNDLEDNEKTTKPLARALGATECAKG